MKEFLNGFLEGFISLWNAIFVWELPTGNLNEGDCIVVHAAGNQPGGDPGEINRYLASQVCIIRALFPSKPLPIIAQGEVAECLKGLYQLGRIPLQRDSPTYLTTIDVAKMQRDICKEYGLRKPILVVSRPVTYRAAMASRKIGFDVIVYQVPKTVWDPKSEQIWMRNGWINRPRELAVRILWFLQGKI